MNYLVHVNILIPNFHDFSPSVWDPKYERGALRRVLCVVWWF
ncbi:hypothetical protein ZOSMA_47G00020 [Zostera marina]|uniref:Uncharacterized protein n=1 Tax=Zostera marina TaxID=29655 RepID=A0A0K9NZR6_ZOSMR|nr:hypothetical protein ZOSMA_47G00020 [Zostera marina]